MLCRLGCFGDDDERLRDRRRRNDRPSQDNRTFDGTIGSLSRCFQSDDESPVQGWRYNTRRSQLHIVGRRAQAFGARALSALGLKDFRRW